MSKLPQTDELPHTDEGFDPARVEQAFATFAERVQELESVASELRAELRSLRSERAASGRLENENWPVDATPVGVGLAADWVATVPPPFARALTVPRLAIEGAFLLLVAGLAGLADLAPRWIVLVMAIAWALVALAEWAAAAKRAHWRLGEIAPAVTVPGPDAAESTGPWDMPVVGSTAIESQPSDSESKTVVTKLPVEPEVVEVLEVVEDVPESAPAPKRRGLRFRRRRKAEASAADPWEV